MLPWCAWGCWLQARQSAASWRTQPAPSSRPGGKQPQEEEWRWERSAAAPGAAEGRFPAPKLSLLRNTLRSRSSCGISGLDVTSKSEVRTCGLQIPAAGALKPACVSRLQQVHEVCASYKHTPMSVHASLPRHVAFSLSCARRGRCAGCLRRTRSRKRAK